MMEYITIPINIIRIISKKKFQIKINPVTTAKTMVMFNKYSGNLFLKAASMANKVKTERIKKINHFDGAIRRDKAKAAISNPPLMALQNSIPLLISAIGGRGKRLCRM